MLISNFRYYSIKELDLLSQIAYANKIYSFLFVLNLEYPGFNKWYWSLFENSILKNEREIIFYVFNDSIAGVAILKHSKDENKICTLRVSPKFQNMGIGSALMEKSFEILDDNKPLITIHISKYNSFKSIFEKYNFSLEQQILSYYGLFKSELSYNGILSDKLIEKKSIIDVVAFSIESTVFGYPQEKKIFVIPTLNQALLV
ncbi:MAG: GNAT family N-acetyltransferase [Oscillospiraceae bacterium]